jgi:hypothetical protein
MFDSNLVQNVFFYQTGGSMQMQQGLEMLLETV